jgi:hypothetical protein
MKRIFSTLLMASALASGAQAQNTDKIYVDAGTRQTDISKSMYGVFFEEINHAGDGGLYGELLQNRGFEEQVITSLLSIHHFEALFDPTASRRLSMSLSQLMVVVI